jgi:hypothetical protein
MAGMEIKLTETLVAAAAAIVTPSLTYGLTKWHERNVAQHNLKLGQYQEFMDALAGLIEGEAAEEDHRRFGRATNTLQLVASNNVIVALHAYREQISYSNQDRRCDADDRRLLSKLVWEIRKDLNDPPTPTASEFSACLWASGPPKPSKVRR